MRGNAELCGTTSQQIVIFVGRHLPRLDVEPPLGLLKVRGKAFNTVVIEAEPFLPELQGGGGCTKRAGPVDGGGSTHAAALQNVDGLVFCLSRGTFLV